MGANFNCFYKPATHDYIANQGYLQAIFGVSFKELPVFFVYQELIICSWKTEPFPVQTWEQAHICRRTWSSYHGPVFWNAGL